MPRCLCGHSAAARVGLRSEASHCGVFGGWNNVVCMQLQVRFIVRNENVLKIKETFFFVFTVPPVGLTPTLNLQGSFLQVCRLNPWVPSSFGGFFLFFGGGGFFAGQVNGVF